MLDISPMLLLFTAVIFLALLVFLNKALYKPLLDFMENRDNVLEKDRKHINKNESDVVALEEEAKAIILEAKSEVAKQRAIVIEEAKEDIAKKLEQRKAELDEEYGIFTKDMENEKKELKNGLLAQMPLFKEGIKAKLSQL